MSKEEGNIQWCGFWSRLYLTLPVANMEGERSFSVPKKLKNQPCSTISQDKLCNLSLLTIEADLAKYIDFECNCFICQTEI